MNYWIMFIIFADRLAWTTTYPSLRLISINGFGVWPKGQSASESKSRPGQELRKEKGLAGIVLDGVGHFPLRENPGLVARARR
jgi:pimeloyl-ACP methyl ester carboxylesterase